MSQVTFKRPDGKELSGTTWSRRPVPRRRA